MEPQGRYAQLRRQISWRRRHFQVGTGPGTHSAFERLCRCLGSQPTGLGDWTGMRPHISKESSMRITTYDYYLTKTQMYSYALLTAEQHASSP